MIPFASTLRIAGAVAAVAVLASSHWWAYDAGREKVQQRWHADVAQRTAAALVAEQQARAEEKRMADQLEKVRQSYAAEKNRRAAADRAATDSLRRLESILAAGDRERATDPATPARADDDPRDGIIAECASTLVGLDRAYRALAGQTTALQEYTRSVCLTPPN